MNTRRILLATAALGIAAAIAVPVVAGPFGCDGSGPGGGMHSGMMPMHGGGPGGGPARFQRLCQDVDARVAGGLAYAEARLGLTDTQKPGWTRLADTVKGATQPIKQACASIDFNNPPDTLPERLERMDKMVSAGATLFQTVRPAITDFYNTLTPEQKQTADRLMEHRWRRS